MKLPNMPAPCKQCPFRKDTLPQWLGAERMTEILSGSTFVCHKDHSLQCAGHMLIKGRENKFVWLANAMDMELNLTGRELIFDTEQKCIEHHT